MFFITLAEMVVSPLSQSIANALADPRSRGGRYMGLYSLITGLGRTLASSISGVLLTYAIKQPLALWGALYSRLPYHHRASTQSSLRMPW
ncbi:hypothetical protein [Vulcanisaeta distributa]|uniref:hypothetical protein n=1 Tax=Vulcanisaeta distributa TaxID=164451 RepID=UPI000A7A0B55|nr:hypothetical protein [Vulcanisaeta distributa]